MLPTQHRSTGDQLFQRHSPSGRLTETSSSGIMLRQEEGSPRKHVLLKACTWDFPGNLVIKTLWFYWRGAGLIPGSAKHYFCSYSIGQAKSCGYLTSRGKEVSSYHGIWGNRTRRLLISTDTVCMPMIGRLQMEGLSWCCSRDVVDKNKEKGNWICNYLGIAGECWQ